MAVKPALRRFAAVAGLLAVAAAGPSIAALNSNDQVRTDAAPGQGRCLAWLGAKGTGTCISRSNGSPVSVGTPGIGIGAGGVYSGPLGPGTSVSGSIPIG